MPYHILPTALPVGVHRLMPSSGGIRPLTRTIFDPSIFLIFSKSNFFQISPTSPKKSIMGNYLDLALKIVHRGNAGSHKGKKKFVLYARMVELCIITIILLFLLYGHSLMMS